MDKKTFLCMNCKEYTVEIEDEYATILTEAYEDVQIFSDDEISAGYICLVSSGKCTKCGEDIGFVRRVRNPHSYISIPE